MKHKGWWIVSNVEEKAMQGNVFKSFYYIETHTHRQRSDPPTDRVVITVSLGENLSLKTV